MMRGHPTGALNKRSHNYIHTGENQYFNKNTENKGAKAGGFVQQEEVPEDSEQAANVP